MDRRRCYRKSAKFAILKSENGSPRVDGFARVSVGDLCSRCGDPSAAGGPLYAIGGEVRGERHHWQCIPCAGCGRIKDEHDDPWGLEWLTMPPFNPLNVQVAHPNCVAAANARFGWV